MMNVRFGCVKCFDVMCKNDEIEMCEQSNKEKEFYTPTSYQRQTGNRIASSALLRLTLKCIEAR